MKWYHYGMLSFPAQLLIVVVCVLFALAQLAVYEINEEHFTVFEGQCNAITDRTIETKEGENVAVFGRVTAECEGERIDLTSSQSAFYFHQALTYDRAPAIMCKKIETEYLKSINWKCSIEGINEA